MAKGNRGGRPLATHCVDCGVHLNKRNKVPGYALNWRCYRRRKCKANRERWRRKHPDARQIKSNRRGRPPVMRPSQLGNASGLEAWHIGQGETWDYSRQKYLRALLYQAALLKSKPIKFLLSEDRIECPLDTLFRLLRK